MSISKPEEGQHHEGRLHHCNRPRQTVADGYKLFEKAGITTAIDEQVETGARDMVRRCFRIRDAKPDLIFDLVQAAPEATCIAPPPSSASCHPALGYLASRRSQIWGSPATPSTASSWSTTSPDNRHACREAEYQKRYG